MVASPERSRSGFPARPAEVRLESLTYSLTCVIYPGGTVRCEVGCAMEVFRDPEVNVGWTDFCVDATAGVVP